ncbi:hypothetical protein L7F22_051579 [Adiantum nelumboides]|nr:hypothetical protein [Adiantum nelumboides]
MGSFAPSSAALSAPSLGMNNWLISSSAADHLLTQALTRELCSTSASSSSYSVHSLELSPPLEQSSKYIDGLLHPQAQSLLSQVGSPLSSDSVCKEPPESPFNHFDDTNVFGMSTTAASSDRVSRSCVTHHHQAPQGGYNKASQDSGVWSSQAAAGAVASKVSKRRSRSRSNKKAPIAVLATDTSNFRAMVQQLTGIPTPQALPPLWSNYGVPLLKPQPTRLNPLDLTTLDRSSSFLAPKINPVLQAGHLELAQLLAPELSPLPGKGKFHLGSSYYPNVMDLDALLALSSASTGTRPSEVQAKANLDVNWATEGFGHASFANLAKESGHRAAVGLSSTSIENFLMDDEEHNAKASYSAIDSWLSFDGGAIANHSPRVVDILNN